MSTRLCRWGLLSTAAISRKNWKAIALSQTGTITAVASRDTAKAQQFIDECSAEVPLPTPPAAVGDYDSLLTRADVDVVYVALPTGLRKPWVIKAAEAGKHVLCEKPVASSTADAEAMIEACRHNGVQFMDGVMFSHSKRLDALRPAIEGLGALRRITSHFTFCGGEAFERGNIRVNSELEPAGCLGDLGWYNLRFILWAMNFQMPQSVIARTLRPMRGDDSPAEVPGEFAGELFFADGVSASFFCSFQTENLQLSLIAGERGYITVDDFVLPFYAAELAWDESRHVLEIDNCRWNMRRHTQRSAVVEYASGERDAQEVRMIVAMNRCVLDGEVDPHWPKIALQTQRVMDACRASADAGGRRIEIAAG